MSRKVYVAYFTLKSQKPLSTEFVNDRDYKDCYIMITTLTNLMLMVWSFSIHLFFVISSEYFGQMKQIVGIKTGFGDRKTIESKIILRFGVELVPI